MLDALADSLLAVPADTEYAAALEDEAIEYPEQRGGILLEAAQEWLRAGEAEPGCSAS